MILFIPTRKLDLTGLPDWFVRIYAVIYAIAFAALLLSMAYVVWKLI